MVRRAGVRMTRQRSAVLEAILDSDDHPTAAQIFERASARIPGLSLATVYNCLETMSAAGIINKLHFDNGTSRYCPNLFPHAHFMDVGSNCVYDIHLKDGLSLQNVFDLPEGVTITGVAVCLRGSLPTTSHETEKK
ncbi:MAG: Fur family transcriptional regulator [Akkermansia sp.]